MEKVPVQPRLRIATLPVAQQTNMQHKQTGRSGGYLSTMYDHLIWEDVRGTGEFLPMLATEWSISSDANTWTTKLRKDIPFHDGNQFTARDVVKTLDVLVNSDIGDSTGVFKRKIGSGENLEIVNDHELKWHTVERYLDLPFSLTWNGDLHIISADYWDSVGEEGYLASPIGTGPFKFVEHIENSHFLVERFKGGGEDHWWKIPGFDEVNIFWIPEGSTRIAMLLANEADIAQVPNDSMPLAIERGMTRILDSRPNLLLHFIIGGQYLPVKDPRTGEPEPAYDPDNPLLDPRVREALNLAVDREQLREAFVGERGVPASVFHFRAGLPDFKEEWTPRPFDPERARELLAEAGYPDGGPKLTQAVVTNLPATPESADISEAVAAMWNDVGFDIELENIEFGTYVSMLRDRQTSRSLIIAVYAPNLIEATVDQTLFLFNRSFITEELFELYYKLKESLDPQERFALSQQIGDLWYNGFAGVPLFWVFGQAAANPNVIAEYQANMISGPVRDFEFAVPVYK